MSQPLTDQDQGLFKVFQLIVQYLGSTGYVPKLFKSSKDRIRAL